MEDLKAAYENALDVYLRAISVSRLALEEYALHGGPQAAAAYASAAQTEGQRHAEYVDLAKRYHLASMRQQAALTVGEQF
jgi:hypothetical protein